MKIEPRPPKAANLKAFLKINNRASLQAPQKLFPLIAIYLKLNIIKFKKYGKMFKNLPEYKHFCLSNL
jgi:hypothetical protein